MTRKKGKQKKSPLKVLVPIAGVLAVAMLAAPKLLGGSSEPITVDSPSSSNASNFVASSTAVQNLEVPSEKHPESDRNPFG